MTSLTSTSFTSSKRLTKSFDCPNNCGPAGHAGLVIVISTSTFDWPSSCSSILML